MGFILKNEINYSAHIHCAYMEHVTKCNDVTDVFNSFWTTMKLYGREGGDLSGCGCTDNILQRKRYCQHSPCHIFCQHNIVFLGLFVIHHFVIAILSGTYAGACPAIIYHHQNWNVHNFSNSYFGKLKDESHIQSHPHISAVA